MTIQLLFLITLFAISHGVIGKIDTQIVGGRLAKLGELPYQVSLQRIKTKEHFCGGVIISRYYILTAAHCVENLESIEASTISANVGLINIRDPHAVHPIESFYIHEGYNRDGNWMNDIALLKLESPITYSHFVRPVILRQNKTIPAGTKVVVSGFGKSSFEGGTTTQLYVSDIEVVNNDYCRDAYRNSKNIYDTHICVNDEKEKKGSCQYDSGSPLALDEELIGIASWGGYECGSKIHPDVYARIPSYFQWIMDHIECRMSICFDT
ncbi:trypsin epsilon-like isoform X1 [Temnothorax longispinosus]|uniref:trypsin epsilon-like isoform X1 n=1 Tax=Temnothorax longispinosus TaxID=300112 RepID=UPI003A9A5C0C